MRMRRRILVPIGFGILGAVIAVLVGYPFVHHLVSERDQLTQRIANLENGFNDEQARAAALQKKLDARDREIAAANLQKQKDDLWHASEARTAKQASARISRLHAQLETARNSSKQAQQQSAHLQQRLAELQTQSATLKKQLSIRDDALTQADEQRRQAGAQLAEQQQAIARFKRQLADAQQTAHQAQQVNDQLQQRLAEQQTQLIADKKQLAESNDALMQAHERRRTLEAQLATVQQTAQRHVAQIAEVTKSLQQARDQQQALQAKINAATSAQRAAEADVADLQKKLASAQHAGASAVPAVLAPATGGNEPLQRRLAELQSQLSRYTAQRPAAGHPAARDPDNLAAARRRASELTAAYKAQLEDAAKLKHVDTGTLNQLAAARSALEKAQAEIARIEGARGIYTVQGGDSLSLIAAFFYHNGNRWPQIFNSNAFLVSNPDLIFPGMVLIIPE